MFPFGYLCTSRLYLVPMPGTHGDQKKVSGVTIATWVGCWEPNPGPLGEHPVLLTSGPSLQPPTRLFFFFLRERAAHNVAQAGIVRNFTVLASLKNTEIL